MAGFDISQLKGTPLYALAKNANVYGGKTLSKTEMVFFQQQCKEMGFKPEKFGLEIVTEDIEGENFKETRKNQEKLTDSINDAYKSQFGRKNNAVDTAKGSETKAYAIINTAKEAFTKAHGDNNKFVPDSLGQRPNFMDPQYKDNLTKYVTDLNVWANKVAEQYRNAADMTSKDLAAMIMNNEDKNAELVMKNDNENAEFNAEVTVKVGEAVMDNLAELQKQIADGTAQIIKEVQIQGGATRVAIKNAKGEVIEAVRTAEGKLMDEVQWQSWYTRGVVLREGEETRREVRNEGAKTRYEVRTESKKTRREVRREGEDTRQEIQQQADRIIETLDPIGKQRAVKAVKDAAAAAGKKLGEFIQENPEFTIPILGIPLWAAKKMFE